MPSKDYNIDPNTVYISFNSECKPIVESFIQILDEHNIAHHQSITDDLPTISDFEREIGRGKIVVIFYCKKYFTSSHCMNEYAEIRANQEGKRVYTVKCDGVVFDANFRNGLIRFWNGEKGVVTETPHEERTEVQNAAYDNEFYLAKDTRYCIFKLGNYFRDIPYTSAECNDEGDVEPWAKDNLEGLANKIQNFVSPKKTVKEPFNATPVHNTIDSLPPLPEFRTRDNIIERKIEIEQLEKYLAKKRLVNMIGLGGCGKSMLSECFYIKNKDNFNFVTSVIINTDYYRDFIDRFRGSLSLEYVYQKQEIDSINQAKATIGYQKTYEAIIDKLEKYPLNGAKNNLIVIDINETAPYSPIRKALDKFETRLKTWRILVVSREAMCPISNVYTLENVTEVATKDLKEIFMLNIPKDEDEGKYNYYKNDFNKEELNKLFGYLLNLPILVVQLARYLMRVPKKSYNEILRDLKIDEDLFNKKFAGRPIPEKEQYKMIGDYLGALVFFEELDLPETGTLLRDIVRHLALWPQKICTVDFIEQFVAVGDSAYTVAEGMSFLVDKCIVTTRGKDADITYQIHGEIAQACREQIYTNDDNKLFRDFSEYFRRVDEFDMQYDKENKQHKDYRAIIADSFRFIIPNDDDAEKFILRKAHEYQSAVIYEHVLKIKYLKLTCPGISIGDIYEQIDQIDTPVDVLYYSWLDKASGYSSNLGDYKNVKHLPEIDQLMSEMVAVKGGTFKMGAQKEDKSKDNYDEEADGGEAPVHIVTLDDFYLAKTQVTQVLWKAVMGDNPSWSIRGDDYPVESVTWYDCLVFIMKLNEMTKMKFRLPTEEQWEFAARGGNKSQKYKYSGSNNIGDVAWYRDNSNGHTHPVKQKNANELGIYDMSGNVYEWCQNRKGNYPNGAVTNPQGKTSGSSHVLRGGSWYNYANDCRVSYRSYLNHVIRFIRGGLRLALSVPQ